MTPAGKPAIVTCTLEENPFAAVARTETVCAVPLAVNVTAAGFTLKEKSACATCTASEACALAVWPPTVAENKTVAVAVAADEAAVIVIGSATPGVADRVDGEMVTPAGSPVTATVVAPLPAGAVSIRDACCPAAPAVKLMLEGVRVRVGWLALFALLLLHEARPATSRLLIATEKRPPKKR